VRFWTAHLRADAEPILVREGFSWGALLFGPFWLALHAAWIPAALTFAAWVLVRVVAPEPLATILCLALGLFLGLTGNDLRRWSIEHRRYLLGNVIAARDEAEALGRLLSARPDLAGRFMPPGTAR
jgi:hypothetical protein